MSFDDILNTIPEDSKEQLIKQALKKQEYNRNYQRRLRLAAKLATLEKRIEENLDHVLGYIKANHADEYENWTVRAPITKAPVVPAALSNWALLAAPKYRTKSYAYDVSGLQNQFSFDEFATVFDKYFIGNDTDGWTQKD